MARAVLFLFFLEVFCLKLRSSYSTFTARNRVGMQGEKKGGGVEIYAAAFISHLECLIKFRLHREAIKAGK